MQRLFQLIIVFSVVSLFILFYQAYNTSIIFHGSIWDSLKGNLSGLLLWTAVIVMVYFKSLLGLSIILSVDFFSLLISSFMPMNEEFLLALKQIFAPSSLASFLGGVSVVIYFATCLILLIMLVKYLREKQINK